MEKSEDPVLSIIDENETIDKNAKYKMRSYLKRCESAISSISLSNRRTSRASSSSSLTGIDNKTSQSTSSWYVDEVDDDHAPDDSSSNKIGHDSSASMLPHKSLQLKEMSYSDDSAALSLVCRKFYFKFLIVQ